MAANPQNIALEPAAQEFSEATSNPPFLYQLTPEEGRKAVDGVQDSEIFKPEIDEEWITVEGGPTGSVPTRIVKPKGATGTLPVILYTHGAGWVFGDAHTHDRLVRDLAVGTGAAVVFPEYDRAPEHQYPVQNEQSYAVAQWVVQHGAEKGLDGSNVAIAGDSVGGNMAIALNLMGDERGDVSFKGAVLFYPVTDAKFDTESYQEFAEGYFLALDGMKWFWDQYTTSEEDRAQITASPLRATEEQLAFFPPTLVINGEADVLRDEGEAFAAKLRRAGVEVTQVRYAGIIHDFVMVNSMHDTHAAKAAVAQAVAHLKAALLA
ncbi:Carboxylesterase NlhH [Frondihabitans sp. 762G35]|uniref:alpha/beta hydrolase n=1 Tax=Frondihabitans sp. 762G35 TaxID=1446794 RepID=UPI000D219A9D|nr:alpha/beta hydrolase [Frondihabitans sp. 762G35]ARC58615.1 Carboxylesterase NlhH [Frondihabitans sp. 762G35]